MKWSDFNTGDEVLEAASLDFGRVVRRRPRAVARPQSAQETADIIRAANREGWQIAIRGAGHSQGGRPLSDDGLVLDMGGLNKIGDIEGGQIRAQGGARWGDIVSRTYPEGYLPLALTSHLGVTVGGTLSAAGFTETSHLYGFQSDTVTELEVVTGDGRLMRCSPNRNAELFDCVLCGQGQFGVILEAEIKLRKVRPQVRRYELVYGDVDVYMQDLELIVERGHVDYLDTWCVPVAGGWHVVSGTLFARRAYLLNLAVEWHDEPPGQNDVLEGLHYTQLRDTADFTTVEYVTRWWDEGAGTQSRPRQPSSFGHGLGGGWDDWGQAHPSMEGIFSWEDFPGFMAAAFDELPGSVARTSRVLLGPVRRDRIRSRMLMRPDGELLMAMGILIELPEERLQEVLPALARASGQLLDAGGKRYLSSWVDFDAQQWRDHFGEHWGRVLELKQEFDPQSILRPGGMPLQP
jgi:FAD/FMN-containing dehydrogenase